MVQALVEGVAGTISDLTWFVFVFFVPFLVVTAVMLFWQLVSRRGEPLYAAEVASVIDLL